MNYDVFISYSSKDVKLVRTITRALHAAGLRVYCDDLAGHGMCHNREDVEVISKILVNRMKESNLMIVVDTVNSRTSKWVAFETKYFKALNKPIEYIKNY